MLVTFVLIGCGSSARLSPDAIRNAPYNIPGIGTISFDRGSYDRAPTDATGVATLHIGQIDLFAYGDLDGDGAEDAVTLLATKSGTPSIFISMEAFLNRGGMPSHAATVRVGDRVAIDSLTIGKRVVSLYLITKGPEDSICCPTLHVVKQYGFENGSFIELPGSYGM